MKKQIILFSLVSLFIMSSCTKIDDDDTSEKIKTPVYTEITRATSESETFSETEMTEMENQTFIPETEIIPVETVTEETLPLESTEERFIKKENYIYNTLTTHEKNLYNELCEAVSEFKPSVTYSEETDEEEAKKIFYAVYNEEPELFWLDSLYYTPDNQNTQYISYRYTESETMRYQQEIDKVADDLLAQLVDKSDYEKVRCFHDYIVTHCEFSSADDNSCSIYGALCVGVAQCEGYARAFSYLCRKADIECISVVGSDYKIPENTHSWNKVMLDDIWYNVDCTWDDPIKEKPDPDYIRYYYLLVSDNEILGKSHVQNEEYLVYPQCYDSSRDYYRRENLMADSAADAVEILKAEAIEALENDRYTIQVRFDNSTDYDNAQVRLFTIGEIRNVIGDAADSAGKTGKIQTTRYMKNTNDDLNIIIITMLTADS